MKKNYHYPVLYLLALVLFFGCQKEKPEPTQGLALVNTSAVTKRLIAFKQNLQSKSNEALAADSAEWYLEGLLNLELANNTHEFGDVDFFHDTIALTVTDGQISLDELSMLYTSIDAWAEALQQQSGNEDYTFDIVDLNIETTGLKSGTQNLIVTLSGGGLGTGLNYTPFGTTDYWYWGYGLGKCGEYSGYIGKDASTELQRKFRNPIAVPGATSEACAPKRMVPPRSDEASRFCTVPSASSHSSIRAMTGCGVLGSNSVELASVRPALWRAYSMVATCMPRQMPR